MLYGAMDHVRCRHQYSSRLFLPDRLLRHPRATFTPALLLTSLVLALLILPLKGAWAVTKTAFEVHLVSPMVKVFPDSILTTKETGPFRITAVRNEYAPFQVAVTASRSLEAVTIVMGPLVGAKDSIPAPSGAIFLVETVPVEKPSIQAHKRGVRKLSPAFWPDPLPPFRPVFVDAGRTRAAWVDLFIPADTRPGLYRGSIVVSVDAVRLDFPLEVTVRDIAIPTAPSIRTAFGNGGLPACLEKVHSAPIGSPQHQRIREEYYWFLVEHRLSPYHIPVDIFSEDAHRFLDDPRVTSFVVPVGGGAGEGGEIWDDKAMKRLSHRLEETGWVKKGVFYLIDEPSPETVPDVIKLGKRIHAINPRFKYLMTPHSGHLLFHKGGVEEAEIDVWVPLLRVMSSRAERNILLSEQKRGKELWWYTCLVPKWKGINYFIDEEATAPRLHPWMNRLYGNQGILYWATDDWTRVNCDPWQKAETYPTGNGDGSLLYPGRDGYHHPVASIRLKMLREGLEDYELLTLLGTRLKETAAKIGDSAVDYQPEKRLFEHAFALITEEGRSSPSGDETPYLKYVTIDYRHIERQRDMVLEEIEQTCQGPLLLVDTIPCDNGYTSGDASVTGYAAAGTSVRVNGNPVPLRQNRFVASVPLVHGPNVIMISGEDGKGGVKTIKRTINRK